MRVYRDTVIFEGERWMTWPTFGDATGLRCPRCGASIDRRTTLLVKPVVELERPVAIILTVLGTVNDFFDWF